VPAVKASRRPRWGQNFLADPRFSRRIVDALGLAPGETVVEIGPGRGALTGLLLEAGLRVVAIEIDARLAVSLRSAAAGRPLVVVTEDARRADLGALLLAVGAAPPVSLVGNLPYESATPMLRAFVRRADLLTRLVVMVQREVADRLAARPGTRAWGYLSLDVGAHAKVRRLFDVPPGAFSPPPKVTSSVVELLPHPAPPGAEEALAVASTAFMSRRKAILNALVPRWGRERAAEALAEVGILPLTRAEELPLLRFVELAKALGAPAETPSPGRSRRMGPATIS
jgi:16S rRNA (adenine1518-N6/adenine1519-N6)-dimethyltransferase